MRLYGNYPHFNPFIHGLGIIKPLSHVFKKGVKGKCLSSKIGEVVQT
jgi:hypothetical protein